MQQRRAFELLTRLGFAARGLLYIVVGLLVIGAGRAEDASGVLEYLRGGVGRWLVYAMAAGFAGYGLWRLADALLAIECRGEENEKWKRIGAGVSAAVHLYLAKQSWDIAAGAARLSENGARDGARDVLALPGGQLLLGAVAAALLVAGAIQLLVAWRCRFLDKLDQRVRETWVKWLGRAGYAARGMVFLIAGYFLAKAALADRAAHAGGLEQALEWVSAPTEMLIAGGLLLFGIFGLIEARYRRIHTPDVGGLTAQARAAVG